MKTRMMTSTLDESTLSRISTELQATLVDLIALSLIAKQAHWNVVGPTFRSVHLHLDEIVETAREASDEVAERCAAVGVPPSGQADVVAEQAELANLPTGILRDVQVIDIMTERLATLSRALVERISHLGDIDPVSQDILIQLAEKIDKHQWMMRSQQA